MAIARRSRRGSEPTVHSVTTVPASPAQDRHNREVQYLLAMTLRIICIGAAMVTTGPVRWVAAALAVFLPWVAVLIANNHGEQRHVRVDPGARAIGATSSSPSPQESNETPIEVAVGIIHPPPPRPAEDA